MILYHSHSPMRFQDRGFVIHGITSPSFKGRVSAWFDSAGAVKDAEIKPHWGSMFCRPVKQNGPIWRALSELGKRNSLGA